MSDDRTREALQKFADLFSETEAGLHPLSRQNLMPQTKRHFLDVLQNIHLIAVVLDTEGTILMCNNFLLETTGWTRNELIGKNWFELLIPDDDKETIEALFARSVESGEVPIHYENEILTKAGERRLIRFSNGFLKDDDRIVSLISFGEDVTDRRLAEEALDAERRKMRLLYEHNPAAIVVMDPNQRITYANKRSEALAGKSVDELEGRKCFQTIMGQDEPCDECPALTVLETKKPVERTKHEITSTGKENWLHQVVYPVLDKNGEIESIVEIARDITESVKTMQALVKSEEQYRTLAETAQDPIFIIDKDLAISYANTSSAFLFNLKPEEMIGKRLADLFPPEEAESQIARYQHIFATGEPVYSERKVPFPSGDRWSSTRLVPLVIGGEISCILGISRDITERINAEEALRESEKKFRMVVEQSRDGIFIGTFDGKVMLFNEAMTNITGYTMDEVNKNSWFHSFFPDTKWRVEATVQTIRAFREEVSYFEMPIVRKDGRRAWMSFSVKPTVIAGKKYGLYIVNDITERKAAEHKLQRAYEAERRIAAVLQDSLKRPIGIISGLDIGLEYRTAYETEKVGGDFYDVFELDDDKVALLIGDVTGKGVASAGLTETIRSSIRTLAYLDPSPTFVLNNANHSLLRQLKPNQLAAAAFYVLDMKTGEVIGASAGHPPAVVCRKTGCRFLDLSIGLPLGTFSTGYEESHVTLEEGDGLILFTDGLIKSSQPYDALTKDQLLEILWILERESARQMVRDLLNAVSDIREGGFKDDVAVLAVYLSRRRTPELKEHILDVEDESRLLHG